MPKINILPKALAELIAAGEVVERPSSVVKELVENSIDAGATKITVEIKNGGVRYIRITDNGCGIAREDVRAAFISHATSKIKTPSDLDSIFTLGFRGEALASVAAVSHIEMLTKTADEEIGTRYMISGGREEEVDDAGCPDGTTIMIRDLFYNTPARMKFLKKDMTEGGYVADILQKIALSHPEISMTLIKDNRRTFFTPGDGRLMTVINEVYGREFGSGLIEAEGEVGGIKVKGYISKPVNSRANRTMQHLFVNGRYVKIPVAASALDNAYKNQIMVGKYPSCVLFLTVNPSLVDVNVHPAKTQVRFSNEKSVYDVIYFTAVSSLKKGDTPVSVSAEVKPVKNTDNLFRPKTEINQVEMKSVPREKISLSISTDSAEKKEAPPIENMYKGIKREFKPAFRAAVNEPQAPFFRSRENEDEDVVLNMPGNKTELPKDDKPQKENVTETVVPEKIIEVSSKDEPTVETPEFVVIGEVFNTYILLQMKNELVFIDKHAAHERIIFNELMSRDRKVYSQVLMMPVTVTLSTRDYQAAVGNLDLFKKSGYLAEDFGEGTIIIRECPTELSDADVTEIVQEIADKLAKNSSDPEPEKLSWLYHSTACRAAIKAGDNISKTEMEDLAKRVLTDDDVRYCPHGRPVMFTMSEYEIKKLFGRNG